MKRKVITVIITLSFLLLLSLVEQTTVLRVTNIAMEQTQEILTDIREVNLKSGLKKSRDLDRSWDEMAVWLEILVDHSATDEVRYALSRLIAALEEEDSATAMVYASELEGSIEHVFERQALTIENIF